MKKLIFANIFLCLIYSASFAEETVQTPDGRKILLKDDGTYSVLTAPVSIAGLDDVQNIDIVDLMLDIATLVDKKVKFNARVLMLSDGMARLTDPSVIVGTTSIWGDPTQLDRESKKKLLRCNLQCEVSINGTVYKNESGVFGVWIENIVMQ